MQGVKVFGDAVAIKVMKIQQITEGGIEIAEDSNNKMSLGEIVVAGPGKTSPSGAKLPMKLNVGQVVVFNKFAGHYLRKADTGEDVLVVEGRHILGTVVLERCAETGSSEEAPAEASA